MSKNIFLNSFTQSFNSLWKNKTALWLLIFLQITFFAIFFTVSNIYIPKIIEHAKAISDYLNGQKLDDIAIAQNILHQQNILGDDPLSISRNFNAIAEGFRIYLIVAFILLIIFLSLMWSVTMKTKYKFNIKQFNSYFFKILLVLIFYLGLTFWLFYSILNISFSQAAFEGSKLFGKYTTFFILSIVLMYFMNISISSMHKTEFKNLVQKTLTIGIKKMHYILGVYLINIFFITSSIFLLVYFVEKSFFIMIFSILLLIFSFVFGRVFMLNVVDKLE